MWTALTILFWVFAAVLALLLAALVSPLRFEFRASAGEALRYHVALRPFGRFGPRISVADSDKPREAKRKQKEKRDKPEKRSTRSNGRRMIQAAPRLVSDIVGVFRIQSLVLDATFGTGDPAETGEIYGVLTPLLYGTAGCQRFNMRIIPVFDAVTFDGRVALDVTMTPGRLLWPFARFGWAAFGPNR